MNGSSLAPALDVAPAGFLLVDEEGRTAQVNAAAAAILGRAPEELTGTDVWQAFPEPVAKAFRPHYLRLRESGGVVDFTERYPDLGIWLRLHAAATADGICVWLADVTENHERADRLRLLLEQVPAAVWTTDLDLVILSANGRALTERHGSWIGRSLRKLVEAGSGTPEMVAGHEAALAGGTGCYDAVLEGVSFQVVVEPRRDAEGRVTGTIGLALDVSGRREIEQALEARARQQEAIAGLGLHALTERDPVAVAEHVAEVLATTLGTEFATVVLLEPGQQLRVAAGHGWGAGVVGATFPLASHTVASEVLRSGEPLVMDDLEGSSLPSFVVDHGVRSAIAVAIPGEDAPIGYLVTSTTARREFSGDDAHFLRSAANVLASATTRHAQERRFRAVFDGALDAKLLADDEGRYVEVNDAACRLFGRAREELLGQRPHDLLGDPERTALAWQAFLAEGEQQGEVEIPRPDGEVRVASFAAKADVLPGLHFSVLRDVTEARRLEEELRRAQQLETVGRLAGGVAHDFNNLLTAVSGYAELVLERLDPGDPNVGAVGEIASAAARGTALTRQLLAFGRRQVLQPVVLDLNEVVAEAEPLLSRLVGDDVTLAVSLRVPLAPVKADPAQIGQVLLNLAVNARDAMPEGGRVSIETEAVELAGAEAEAARLAPGAYVVLRVRDEGRGMDADTLARAFDPFFTTKEPGQGTGLGLSTVLGVVEQTGGRLLADSAPGEGATFSIYLPPAETGARPEREEGRPPRPAAGPPLETVLVLEDEPLVRSLVREILEREGYDVLEAELPSQAFALAESRERLDLLVTDVVMPELSGSRVAQILSERQPGLPVVYMSGYSDEAVLRHGVLDGRWPFLQKPFAAADLLGAVRSALAAGAAAPAA